MSTYTRRRRTRSTLTTTQAGYGWTWQKLRLVILARDCYVCHWCGRFANTVDHRTPKVEGGTDDPANLVAACQPCNSRRAAQWINARRRRRPSHPTGALAP